MGRGLIKPYHHLPLLHLVEPQTMVQRARSPHHANSLPSFQISQSAITQQYFNSQLEFAFRNPKVALLDLFSLPN